MRPGNLIAGLELVHTQSRPEKGMGAKVKERAGWSDIDVREVIHCRRKILNTHFRVVEQDGFAVESFVALVPQMKLIY